MVGWLLSLMMQGPQTLNVGYIRDKYDCLSIREERFDEYRIFWRELK